MRYGRQLKKQQVTYKMYPGKTFFVDDYRNTEGHRRKEVRKKMKVT